MGGGGNQSDSQISDNLVMLKAKFTLRMDLRLLSAFMPPFVSPFQLESPAALHCPPTRQKIAGRLAFVIFIP